MAKVRKLKYGIGNATQTLVEQPIFKGIPLKKWIHNGEVIWENGYGIGSICAQYNGGLVVIDLTGEYPMAKILSTTARLYSNSDFAMRFYSNSKLYVSKDFLDWKIHNLRGVLSKAVPTKWGLLYSTNLGDTTNPDWNLIHITIDKETLEIIDDRIIFSKDDGFDNDLFYKKNGGGFGSGTPSLDHFWYNISSMSAKLTTPTVLCEYIVEKDSSGREIVTGYTAQGCEGTPFYGTRKPPTLLPYNRMLVYRRMFTYGTQGFEQIIVMPSGENLSGGRKFGAWLDEQAAKEATEEEPFEVCRERIKAEVQSKYLKTMYSEDVIIRANSVLPYATYQMSIGDDLAKYLDKYDLSPQYFKQSSSASSPIYSGFLGFDIVEDEEVQRKKLLFPLYAYNSTDGMVVKNDTTYNLYDGVTSNKVDGCTNVVETNGDRFTGYAVRYEDGEISYDDSPYYCKQYGSGYVWFRHKKDMDKNFMFQPSTLPSTGWTKLDIPKEWFK